MNTLRSVLREQLKKIDPKLLVFLVLLLNVKLVIKVLAIVIIYIFRPNFRFGFSLRNSRLPLFYPAVIGIAIVDAIAYGLFTHQNYWLSFSMGISIWLICILAVHQLKLFTETLSSEKIYNTLVVFFILNALISFAILGKIIIETGTINPYRYQGEFQKYFMSTGDYIKGISFDTCTTNAAINSFGVLLFFRKKAWAMMLLCMIILVLTGSNLVNFLLIVCVIYLFIFKSVRSHKSVLAFALIPMVIFWSKVSPQNTNYVTTLVEHFGGKSTNETPSAQKTQSNQPQTTPLTDEDQKAQIAKHYLDSLSGKIAKEIKSLTPEAASTVAFVPVVKKPLVPEANIHTAPFQHKDDTDNVRKAWINFVSEKYTAAPVQETSKLPGKVIAMNQTVSFLRHQPSKWATGAGMGMFASKLAFKTTALNISGSYPTRFKFIDPAFSENHLALHLSYFTKSDGLHSVVNTPNSVYDQLAGEYGLAGLLSFAFLYIGFFFRQRKSFNYGLPLLFMMCGLFFTDYWFEQLSIVLLFELLLFLDIQESNEHAGC